MLTFFYRNYLCWRFISFLNDLEYTLLWNENLLKVGRCNSYWNYKILSKAVSTVIHKHVISEWQMHPQQFLSSIDVSVRWGLGDIVASHLFLFISDVQLAFWIKGIVLILQALLNRHARCQELGLSQDICHPPSSLREVPSRPGVETHW